MPPSAEQWITDVLRGSTPDWSHQTTDDFTTIVDTARMHGVLYLMLYLLGDSDITKNPWLADLKQQNFQYIATDLLLSQELLEILSLFNAENLPFLLMKGEVLALTHYPETHLRARCDTDILFANKETSEQAWKLLERRGYARRNTLSGKFVGYQFSCHRELMPKLSISLDIHNKLSDYLFFAHAFDFKELHDQAIDLPQLGEGVRGFSPVYLLLHACLHRISNMPHKQENRLIWIYDIHILCKAFSGEEWAYFSKLAIKKGLAGVCADGLRQSQRLFLTELPAKHLQTLDRHAKNEKFSPLKAQSRWEIYYQDFKNNPGFFNKARQIKEHLFPSVEYMNNKYQPRHIIYLPYYYVMRVVRGLGRYL